MDFAARLEEVKALYKSGRFKDTLGPAQALAAEAEKEFGEDARFASALHEVAEATYELGERAAALPLHLRVLAIRERVLAADDLEIARSLNNAANCLVRADRFEEAAQFHARALTMRRKADPRSEFVGESLNNIANMRMQQHSHAEAQPLLEEAVAIWEQVLGDSEKLAVALSNLGSTHLRLGRLEDAERFYRRSLAMKEKVLAPGHPGIATGVSNLGALLERLNRPEEAEALFQKSLAILEERLGPDNPRLEDELVAMAFRLEDQGKLKEAEALFRRTLAAREKRLGPDHLELSERLIALGKFLIHRQRLDEAHQALSRVLDLANKAGPAGLERKSDALEGLAAVAAMREDLPTAELQYQEAIAAIEGVPHLNPLLLARKLESYAGVCMDLGRDAKAQLLYGRSWEIYDAQADVVHGHVAQHCMEQAMLAMKLGQLANVEPWLRRAAARIAVAAPPADPEFVTMVLDLLDSSYGKAPGLLDKAVRFVAGVRRKPETWVIAAEKSLAEGRLADVKRLLVQADKGAAAGGPELVARVEKVRKALPP